MRTTVDYTMKIKLFATVLLLLAAAACGGGGGTEADNGAAAPEGEQTAAAEDGEAAEGSGEDVQAFYQDNTVRVIGGHDAGGGFDFYMRAVARAMERVCGTSTTVRNIPGAGGLIGDNQLFQAEPDGLTIGLLNYPGHVFAQLTGNEEVQYDFREWEWLGRVASDTPVIIVNPDGDFQTIEDLQASERPVRYGIEGAGSDAFYGAALAAETFGYPHELITGYGGSNEIITAISRGEVDATFLSLGSSIQSIRNGDVTAVVLFGEERSELLPDTPTAREVAETPEDEETLAAFGNIYDLERTFVAPPGTPGDRVDHLRDCLMQVFEDEQFVQEVEDADRVVVPMPGAEVDEASSQVEANAEEIQELLSGIDG